MAIPIVAEPRSAAVIMEERAAVTLEWKDKWDDARSYHMVTSTLSANRWQWYYEPATNSGPSRFTPSQARI